MNTVEKLYNSCVYHNPMHAADVMHATNYLVSGKLAEKIPAEELFAVLLRYICPPLARLACPMCRTAEDEHKN